MEGDASPLALVADVGDLVGQHRPGPRAGFAADDGPVNAAQPGTWHRREQGLQGEEFDVGSGPAQGAKKLAGLQPGAGARARTTEQPDRFTNQGRCQADQRLAFCGGLGYVTSPAVSIVGGGGTGATAVAQITGGVVTGITITDAGFGYTNTPTIHIAPPPAAAVSPTVLPMMRVDSTNLAPHNNYQIQFKPSLGGTWGNWSGGSFSPTGVTNSQYLFITNRVGFFRVSHMPLPD
jgi:hypothetical protein